MVSEQATTAGKAKRVNSVTGVHVDKVDPAMVVGALTKLKLFEAGTTLDQQVTRLWGYYNDATPAEERSVCARCRAVSSSKLDECPFCGHDEALDVAAPPASIPPAAPVDKPKKKEAQQHMTTTTQEAPAAKKANGKALTLVKDDTTKSSALRTERDLDAAVKLVHELKGAGAVAMRTLGEHMLKNIYNTQLWKLRAEDGKPRYKNVDAFCNAELGMSPQNAYKLMSIAEKFSEEQVRAFGTTKLSLLLEAPEPEQPRIQGELESGKLKTTRDVEREVRAANKGASREDREDRATGDGKSGKRKAGRGSSAGRLGTAGTPAPKGITVAKILGPQSVKLFKKPASMKNLDFKGLARAKKLGDVPFGVLELTNEVKMYFTVHQSAAGELVLKTNTVRDAE